MLETYRREGRVDRLPMVAQRQGVRVPGLMSARPVVVEGEDCFLFVFHDMTEAQRASDELRALNNLLQQAGRMARLGAWESTREAGMVYWSDICADIHSLPSGSPPPNDYVECFVAPAWQEMVRAKLHDCHHHQSSVPMDARYGCAHAANRCCRTAKSRGCAACCRTLTKPSARSSGCASRKTGSRASST